MLTETHFCFAQSQMIMSEFDAELQEATKKSSVISPSLLSKLIQKLFLFFRPHSDGQRLVSVSFLLLFIYFCSFLFWVGMGHFVVQADPETVSVLQTLLQWPEIGQFFFSSCFSFIFVLLFSGWVSL